MQPKIPASIFRLADTLSDYGIRLSELGRAIEALPVTQESVTLNRALEIEDPQARRPKLASCLTDLGVRFQELGRWDESLAPTAEAIDMFRELAAGGDESALYGLGCSLSNLGVSYQGLGQPTLAVGFEEESIGIWRILVERSPTAIFRTSPGRCQHSVFVCRNSADWRRRWQRRRRA